MEPTRSPASPARRNELYGRGRPPGKGDMGTGTYTGRLEFDLGGGGWWSLATVDVAVRHDVLIFQIGSRDLCVVDRDRLRRWLAHPWTPLDADQLTFLMLDSDLCVSVDGSTPYVIAEDVARKLTSLV